MSRSIINRRAIAGFLLATGICAGAHADVVTSFSGITSWVGTGSNSAALVIDWNDPGNPNGDTSLVWGYHWSGTGAPTGEQMLDAIVQANPQLYLYVVPYSGYGDIVAGVGYDPAADGNFALSPALSFANNIASDQSTADIDDGRTAINPNNLWEEGWNSGYWAYSLSNNALLTTDGFSSADAWTAADNGITSQTVSNGDWDALIFAPGFDAPASPQEPEPGQLLPEPASLSLLMMGLLCLLAVRGESPARRRAGD